MADNHPSPADLGASTPLAPPLYQSSVYTLPDLDALDRIMDGAATGFIYARDGHPNGRLLGTRLALLEGAQWGIVTGSGMGAISAVVLATVEQGQRIVASNRLYGRTTQLFDQELSRFGVKTTFVNANDPDEVHAALDSRTRLLFVETMSNPLLRIPDLERLVALAQNRGCLLVVDNTFATPVLCRPLEVGADFVMESLTKMIGGHSDVTLGAVCGREDYLDEVNTAVSIWGLAPNPFDCWLTDRGLATLALRMQAASAGALELARWLSSQSRVSQLIYPGLPDHPDYELATKVLQGGYGNMLCFELPGGRDAVNRFMKRAPSIPFSPSLGNTTTTLSHPWTTSHRYVSPGDKVRQGITEGLIRLSVGVEDVEVIKREMTRGLG
jgi:cystathionine beta-lyase/cystathionine gamma-synthase